VLFFLPAPVSIAHAGLAQIFFCLVLSIALFTSRSWQEAGPHAVDDRVLRILASATTAAIYAQILIGAAMRHTGAGLAIPDFPLVFGGVVPPEWTARIALHYAHRVAALIVASAILATAGHIWYHYWSRPELTCPATIGALLVLAQITLGGLTVLSGRAVSINTAHVVTGALVLATSLVVSLRSWRVRFASRESTIAGELPFGRDLREKRSSVGARA